MPRTEMGAVKLDFLILATPRSGSAWLANFLTYGECFCYHDPMAEGSLERLERQAPITGAIDTGAWMWPKRLPAVPKLYGLLKPWQQRELLCIIRRLSQEQPQMVRQPQQ